MYTRFNLKEAEKRARTLKSLKCNEKYHNEETNGRLRNSFQYPSLFQSPKRLSSLSIV